LLNVGLQSKLADGLNEVVASHLLPLLVLAGLLEDLESSLSLLSKDQWTINILEEEHELLEVHSFEIQIFTNRLRCHVSGLFVDVDVELGVELVHLLEFLVLRILVLHTSVDADVEVG